MDKYRYLLAVTVLVLFSGGSAASTWNTFAQAYNEEIALYFFDADTVVRQGHTVTLWVKYVNTKKPDSDGSWQTTTRYVFSCQKRTFRAMTSSIYDKEGNFIRSFPAPRPEVDVVPDTIMEGIYKATCTADFPKNTSRELYFPIFDNDAVAHTRRYLEYLEGLKDPAPK